MKQFFTVAGLILLALSSKAQTRDNDYKLTDSTQHNRHDRQQWHHEGNDSLHQHLHAFRNYRGRSDHQFYAHRNRRDQYAFHRHRPGSPLHYSPEQRKQAAAINTAFRKKSADLYGHDDMTLKEYKAKLLDLRKERNRQLQDLLTQEQKDQIAKRKKLAAENAQVRAAAHLERMKIRLNLSDKQTATIQSKEASFREQMKLIHENEALLPYQKMEQMKTLAANQKDAIRSVLTTDQLEKFEDMHKMRFRDRER